MTDGAAAASAANAVTASGSGTKADEKLVDITVDSLIVGRPLTFPLYDDSGLLLLAQGAVITSDFKRLIRARGVGKVRTSSSAAGKISLTAAATANQSNIAFDTELTKRIDALVDGGLINVVNKGPAAKESIVFLGKKAYDQKQRTALVSAHERNGHALGSMISDALNGGNLDGTTVTLMAADYLREMTVDTDNVLSSTVDSLSKDDDLSARSLETSLLAMALGIEMNLDADNVKTLGLVGLVHDWGMIKVSQELTRKQGELTPLEYLEIQRHPIHSLELLQRISSLPTVVSVVAYQVHEQPDGHGYPRGRKGSAIHPFASILRAADCYVSLTSKRPYRLPMTPYAAMECMLKLGKLNSVDRTAVRALLHVLSLFPIGSYVALSDGSVGKVLRRNKDLYTQPIVNRIQDKDGEPIDVMDPDAIIDLTASEITIVQALPTPGREQSSETDRWVNRHQK